MTDELSSPAAPLHFDAVLRPHRSLSPAGFCLLMAAFALIGFIVGIAGARMGAWPVLGFFGLDVAAVYVAFRVNYRAGREREIVQLSDGLLTVRRIAPDGSGDTWSFQPYWVRVELNENPTGPGQVALTSHGRSIALGRFLNPIERRDFVLALAAALDRQR